MRFWFITFLACSFSLQAFPLRVPNDGKTTKLPSKGHYPLISHLTFRNICDIAIDEDTHWFDPEVVRAGDTIYLNAWYLDWFVENVHDRIQVPYILVTGNVKAWIPDPKLKKLLYDPKLAAWFCRNMIFSYHPKLIQIPMGQDLALFSDIPISTLLDVDASQPKEHLLHMCFLPREHGDRDKIVKLFENAPYCLSRNKSQETFSSLEPAAFYREMAKCQFVLSPLGYETDCVRTWEALTLNCIPIVEHTFLDPSYANLPVAIIHDWTEINPEFLAKKYEELKGRKRDEARFDHWEKLVKETQASVRQNKWPCAALEKTLFSEEDLQTLYDILSEHSSGTLFYKGCFCGLRPLQLANLWPSRILLHDYWFDKETFLAFEKYVQDDAILENGHKVSIVKKETEFLTKIKPGSAIFLDLSYYRTSLFISFRTCVVEYGNFRHSLKCDILRLIHWLPANTLLCGNMHSDPYVSEVLDMLAEQWGLCIEKQGPFWYLKKEV